MMTLHLVIAVGATTVVIDGMAVDEIRRGITLRNYQLARRAAAEIDAFVEGDRGDLAQLAAALDAVGTAPRAQNTVLKGFLGASKDFTHVVVIDSRGRILADGGTGAPAGGFELDALLSAANGEMYTSVMHYDGPGAYVVTMSHPLEGGPCILADMSMARIWTIVDDMTAGSKSTVFVKTRQGTLVAHSDRTMVFEARNPPPAEDSFLRVDSQVDSMGWTVVIDPSGSEAFLPVGLFLRWTLLLVLLVVGAVMFLAFFSVGVISRPLEALLVGTVMIGGGNTEYRIPIRSRDEFGILTRSFNTMVDNLHERALALEESERIYRIVTESVNDIIFSLDSHGRFLFINGRVEQILGYRPQEVLGRLFVDFVAADDMGQQAEDFFKGLSDRTKTFPQSEMTFISKSGQEVIIETEAVPIYEASGEVRIHGVARDVTERKRMEEKLHRTERLSALGEIVSKAAHEMRNAVSGITSSMELLRSRKGADASRSLDMVLSEADRAQRIVKGLLDFSRDSAPSVHPCGLSAVLERVLELSRGDLERSGITVVKTLAPGIPDILANTEQLQQVFLNLIANAIQAMRGSAAGTLTVSTFTRDGIAVAAISDTGHGIPRRLLSRVFDPFFTTKPAGEGSGLGLPISLGIVQAFGGDMRVESVEEQGTTFRVELPLIESMDAKRTVEELPEKIDLSGRKILVVEDEDSTRLFVASFLESYGCRVDSARDVREAVSFLLDVAPPDLVISDFRMPDIDGQGLYEWIRSNKPFLLSRLIYVTGDGLNPMTRAFLRKTGVPYLLKPVGSLALMRSIWPMLKR